MNITLRKFEYRDIEKKIEWINDPRNNQFLHYDIPLEFEKTVAWFEKNKDNKNRYDAVIECDGVPCGLIGLLAIDKKNKKAELYISLSHEAKGKGIATQAGKILLKYAFENLKLQRVYLYTESENVFAQKLFSRIGFVQEGLIKSDLCVNGKVIDRYVYGITKSLFEQNENMKYEASPIYKLNYENNNIYIKREDFLPFSFGGNKARKAQYFFDEIDKGGYDCVVTYGSSSSNHCRVISNLSASRNMTCYIISTDDTCHFSTSNSKFMKLFGAKFITCHVSMVSNTINETIENLKKQGHNPYFIAGGGHGKLGTQAYIDCYSEILKYEKSNNIEFEFIFFASGTGTTHSGLVCGKLINKKTHKIIGISIARKNPYGRGVVIDSIKEYFNENGIIFSDDDIENATIFIDDYLGDGYAKNNSEILSTIHKMIVKHGIPMDSTYVGKAYHGMEQFIKTHRINNSNILFIHTGGTPLFFDDFTNM